MTETSIKQQARRFAEKHGISYTRALAGVTEPLYRLKVEFLQSQADHPEDRKGFRITDSQDSLLEVDANGGKRIRGTSTYFVRPEGSDPMKWYWQREQQDWLLEVARRTQILRDSGAHSFWEQRQLYRAGIASETLEPLAHYYSRDTKTAELLFRWNGAILGIIDAAVDQDWHEAMLEQGHGFSELQKGTFALRKISLDDFQALLLPTQS